MDPRHTLGHSFEDRAAAYLLEQGYQILDRNVSFKVGELDLVATEGETLVFVEVRGRTDSSQVHPAATVNRKKQRQIIKAAQVYCQRSGVKDTMIRFDVVAVMGPKGEIELIRNAFEAGR
jgi:putative endonuclease